MTPWFTEPFWTWLIRMAAIGVIASIITILGIGGFCLYFLISHLSIGWS